MPTFSWIATKKPSGKPSSGPSTLGNKFIDDIFLIFLGTTEQLKSMKDFMNNLHPTIKFTFEYSIQEISFLDMKILIRTDRKLSTTLYRKPTDCAVLLHFNSNHPLRCKENIVFSQALRCNLIADDALLQKELDSLAVSLLARQYPLEIITRNIYKALLHSRDTLLHKPPTTTSPKTVLPMQPHTLQKEDTSPSQYGAVGISLRMTHNCKTSGPTTPSLLTPKPNPSRTS